MNKRELVEAIADRVGDRKTATEAVNAVVDAIQKAVAKGDKVSITGFGAFEMVNKPARTARNPSTGAEIRVAESWGPKFRPGSDFKELVNEGGKKIGKKR
ncbi:HU family DNA-binding protein [Nonomuraea sp. M3C6]|uniref:HU family DNA-binding protein n=1 Tax=Nonomuraea marmarensis TaxID=3351344 RepID=A0ABW7ABD7_9ACTN